jgi:hypothetical protein
MRIVTTALVIATSLVCSAADLKWQTFRPSKAGFSILMPGKAERVQQELRQEQSSVKVIVYGVRVDAEAYFVSYADYPGFADARGREAKLLEAAVAGMVQSNSLLEDKPITLGAVSGRAIKYSRGAGQMCRAHVFLVKERIYQVFVFASKERIDSGDATKFLLSFRLVP